MMVESYPERETVAQSCLVQVRKLPEAEGFEVSRKLIGTWIGVD